MTQDVTDDGTIEIMNAYGQWVKADAFGIKMLTAFDEWKSREFLKKNGFYDTLRKLMLAGFCLTLMAGCSLTYKGPQYDLSTLSGLRPEPVRHRETDGMLSQQRDRQRNLFPR